MPANPELLEITSNLLENFPSGEEQLMDILQAITDKFGYIPPSVIGLVAEKSGISRPQIFNAIEMAPSFALTPPGRHTLYICNAENCCMQGGTELMQHAEQILGIHPFETTSDEKIRLESFQCLGNCSMAPNVMLDGRVFGMMNAKELEKILGNLPDDQA
jgi:formate dehydrogenase subunit gamma